MEKIIGKYTLEQAKGIQKFIDDKSIAFVEKREEEPSVLIYNGIFESQVLKDDFIPSNETFDLYNIYLCKKVNTESFNNLINDLDNIRNNFVEEIYESTRIKPLRELTTKERRESLFPIKGYSNGIDDYVIYQIGLENKIDKEESKGPVLEKK